MEARKRVGRRGKYRMVPLGRNENPEIYTLRQLARELGCTPENIKALEKRGRLPEGCEPAIDQITGTRTWTPEQVKRLKEWNEKRLMQKEME